ncbi:MAG TPA: MFS transporter [Stenomitos sp.]
MAQAIGGEGLRPGGAATVASTRPPSVWLVVMIGLCTFLDLYATQAFLPVLEQAFQASKVAVGMTVSAATLAVALSAPVVGVLAEKFGRKLLIVSGLLGLALTTLLAATSPSLGALIGWRFGQGACTALLYVVTMTYVNEEWAGRGVGAAMSAFVTGNVVGGFLGRFLSGIATALVGWHWAFVVLGGLNLVGALAAWLTLPAAPRTLHTNGARSAIASHLRELTSRPLLAAYLVGFNVLFTLVGTFTYVNFYLAEPPFRLGTLALGSIFAVYLFGSVVTPVAGRWIDRLGNRQMVAIALTVSALGTLLTLVPSLWTVIPGLMLSSSGVFVCQSASTSFVGRAAGTKKALAAGLYVSCYYFGGSVGGVLPGFLWGHGGWHACVALFVAIQALTVAIASRFWRLSPATP